MAVAEKELTQQSPRNPYAPLVRGSFCGALYVLASFVVVFSVLPLVWTDVLQVPERFNEFLAGALLILIVAGAGAGLFLFGLRLEQRSPPHGLRAGIFMATVLMYFFTRFTLGIGNVLAEGVAEPTVGVVVTVAVGLGFLWILWWLFRKPGFCQWLGRFEDQGWFHGATYKPNQGLRVRRGTVVALLVLGLCGIITLVNHRSLGAERRGRNNEVIPNNWQLSIPFAGEQEIDVGFAYEEPTSAGVKVKEVTNEWMKRAGLQAGDVVAKIDDVAVAQDKKPETILRARKPFDSFKLTVVREVDKTVLKDGQKTAVREPEEMPLQAVLGNKAVTVPLMFKYHLIMPILLAIALVWVAWRAVNWPAFADFLIATDAEMHKVSWTTRKRLVQDTIVVLVTVFLLTAFLFVVDIFWIKILSNEWINVLQVDIRAKALEQQEKTQW